MNEAQVKTRYHRWGSGNGFDFNQATPPKVCYVFDQKPQGPLILNRLGATLPLRIPKDKTFLKKRFLSWPVQSYDSIRFFSLDTLINLFGFVPLGIMLRVMLERFQWRVGRLSYFGLVVGMAFLFSISIEITQAWIPSRDSSLLDLLLNTLGAGLGGGVFYKAC